MTQSELMEEIWNLESLLHRIKGKSKKHEERKVILSRLRELSKQLKKNK